MLKTVAGILCFVLLQRLFIRHCTNFKIANHAEFRLWIGLYYSDMDEEKWENVMQDDSTYDYLTCGHGMENLQPE